MSDIIERLYAWPAVEKYSDAFSSQHVGALMEEAAREIEQLRKALEEIAALDHHYFIDSNTKYEGRLARIAKAALSQARGDVGSPKASADEI